MSLRTAIEALVSAAPPSATVPVSWLAELLAAETTQAPAGATHERDVPVDLTVNEVAERFGKGPSTVRTWLARGELTGAYRLHGREWRIPVAAVDAMQRAQATAHAKRVSAIAPERNETADLGAWRHHLPLERAV